MKKMKLIINNKETESSATTVMALAQELQLPEKGVAVAIDNKMVPRNQWGEVRLSDGANIVIIKAACGG